MKSVPKLIRRFAGILLLSSLLLFLLNVALLAGYTFGSAPNGSPWTTAQETADRLRAGEEGYVLEEEAAAELQSQKVWAVLIDDAALEVVWHTENLPETVPMSYSASDIAGLTRGYIDGYPTFTGRAQEGLLVLGYPRDSFWKHMWPSWDYNLIANLPKTLFSALMVNLALIFVIYLTANTRLLKSVKPIVEGIQALAAGREAHLAQTGPLSELAVHINRTSDILMSQARQLHKRETARANWIAGVSHDIRTPLSMVMGYAGQLEGDMRLGPEARGKAAVIVKQSERMRNLVNDLNLASRLEYNMQPLSLERQNLIAVVRRTVVDFMNMDVEGKYPILWETDENLTSCMAEIDRGLIGRALGNLIQNSMNHNGQGCSIHVRVTEGGGGCTVAVADDGSGITEEQLESLKSAPHYMDCGEDTAGQRHGLGLLLVRQIVSAHGGSMEIGHSGYGGFEVSLRLPECMQDLAGSP